MVNPIDSIIQLKHYLSENFARGVTIYLICFYKIQIKKEEE